MTTKSMQKRLSTNKSRKRKAEKRRRLNKWFILVNYPLGKCVKRAGHFCNSNNFAYCSSDDEGDNAEALELSGSEASELSGSEASDVEDEEVEKYVEYDSDENEVDPSTTIYRNNTLCHEM